MIRISTEIKYIHDLLLLVAHELKILQKHAISYKLVESNGSFILGHLHEFEYYSPSYLLGPLLTIKSDEISDVIYVENNNLDYGNFEFDYYESTSLEIQNLVEDVFGTTKDNNVLNHECLFMFYENDINNEAIKKISFAINETVKILNSLDLYSKENIFECFLLCEEYTLTNISFQIYDFIHPVDAKTLIKIKKFIKKM